jgi:hypothetical protein
LIDGPKVSASRQSISIAARQLFDLQPLGLPADAQHR